MIPDNNQFMQKLAWTFSCTLVQKGFWQHRIDFWPQARLPLSCSRSHRNVVLESEKKHSVPVFEFQHFAMIMKHSTIDPIQSDAIYVIFSQLCVTQKGATFGSKVAQNVTILVLKKFSILGSSVYACFGKSVSLVKVSLYRGPQKSPKITNIDSTLLRSVSDLDRGQPRM